MDKAKDLIEEAYKELKKGNWDLASELFGEAVDILEGVSTNDGKTLLAEALRKRGHADSRRAEFDTAVDQLKRAMDLSMSIQDLRGEADALRGLGYVHGQKGDAQMAFVFYEQALKKASDAADMEIIGRTRIEMGNAYNNISEYDNARDQYNQAITILKALGNHNELARAYNNLGDCYIKTGDLEEAIEVLRQCMDLATNIGDDTIKGWAAFNAAECFTRMGETNIAKQYLDIALELLEKSDDKIGVVYTLQIYGQTFMAEKEYALAEDSFNKSISLVRELGMKALEGEVLRVYASMFIDKGDRKGAIEVLKRALGAFELVNREKEAREVRELLKKMV